MRMKAIRIRGLARIFGLIFDLTKTSENVEALIMESSGMAIDTPGVWLF